MKKPFSIAIDGPSAAGKSTLAREIAADLGFIYIDTGALYRAIGYYVLAQGGRTDDPAAVLPALAQLRLSLSHQEGAQHVCLNGEDVSEKIRQPAVSMAASNVSAMPEVRAFLLCLQRELAATHTVVMDGRDIATVILPEADVKFFLTATPEARARRRLLEYEQKGLAVDFQTLLAETQARDLQDSTRAAAPLKPAADSIIIDSTALTLEETLEKMLSIVRGKL